MAGRPWTHDEERRLRELCEQGLTLRQIIGYLPGRSWAAVKWKVQALGMHSAGRADDSVPPVPAAAAPPAAPAAVTPLPPPPDPIEEMRLRREEVRVRREQNRLLAAMADERSLREMLEELFREVAPAIDPPAPYVERLVPSEFKPVRETAVVCFSDWHYGEVVRPEGVRGFNAYDQQTAKRRVATIVDAARSILARLRRGGYRFPRLIVAANGDLVTGSIHDLEKHSNGATVVESVYECGLLLAQSIRDLAADFEQVDVFCTVGNHGRLPDARRMEQKAPLRNWDALVYLFAKTALRDVPNVSFEIPDSYSVGYIVEGWNFLQQHGHDIKSWNNIPWYGIERYVNRISGLEASRERKIDAYLFGHFHQATTLPHATGEMFVNGSLIGGTEFSINALGKADRPSQWLLGVHAEHGVTHRWPLLAEEGLPVHEAA